MKHRFAFQKANTKFIKMGFFVGNLWQNTDLCFEKQICVSKTQICFVFCSIFVF